jgi:long-subunit fatty acid transport protein
MLTPLRAAAAAAVSLALVAAPARANEPDAYGLGSRGSAMGSAMVADATDFSATYYNPAALVGVRGTSLSIGYSYVANHLDINGTDTGVAPVHGVSGGLVAPGHLLGVPFAFGVGVYMPDTGLSQVQALPQQTPRWALYQDRSSIVFIAACLAVRPLRWLELGGGIAFLAATTGQFQVSGTADLLSPYDSKLRDQVDADLTAVRYPLVGARIKIDGFGYLGLAYRGQTELSLAIGAKLQGNIDFAGLSIPLLYNLASRTVDAFLPQQVVAGVSFQRVQRLRVNLDFTFVNWAAYASPTPVTSANLSVQLPPGTPITLPPNPKQVVVIAPDFANRLVPRLGVEYVVPVAGGLRHLEGDEVERRLVEIPLRVGYVYERSPVPSQTGVTNFFDTDRHTLSFGTGVTLNKPGAVLKGSLSLDVHGKVSILPVRITDKDNPADFVGDYRASGSMLGVGSTLTAVF